MSAEVFRGAERVLAATANGVYQGVLVTAIAAIALRLFRTNAATRHAVWFAVLLFVAALIPAHLVLSLRPHHESQPIEDAPVTAPITPGWAFLADADTGFVSDSENPDGQPELFDLGNIDSTLPVATAGPPLDQLPRTETSNGAASGATNEKPSIFSAVLKTWRWNIEKAISLPPSICLLLVLAWAVVAGIRGGLIAERISAIRRAKKTSTAPSESLQGLFNRLRGSLAARRNVQLKISNEHRTAVVLGFLHPVVLLPAEMGREGNDAEVEHVLRHELAHVERRDDWSNLAQQAIQAALFFHPAVWWISSKLSLEREIACDDHVLEANAKPRSYALTLANVASRVTQSRHMLAPGVSNNNSHLQQRINMILNTQRNRSPRLARTRLGFFTVATASLAVLAINAGPRLVLAQPSAAAPIAPSPGAAALPAGQDVQVAAAPPAGQNELVATATSSALPGTAAISVLTPPADLQTSANVQVLTQTTPVVTGSVNLALDATPSADLTPDSPDDAESGPRRKRAFSDDEAAPDVPRPPAPSMAPVPAIPAFPPTPGVPGVRPAKRHMSVEERLDRIERILEDMDARGANKARPRAYDGKFGSAGQNSYGPGIAYATPMKPGGGGSGGTSGSWSGGYAIQMQPGTAYANQRATLQAQAAADQAKSAVDEMRRAVEMGERAAERAKNDMDKLRSQDLKRVQEELRAAESENSTKALTALREARESLRSQMQTLEEQIKRLEQDHDRKNKSGDRSEDDPTPEKPAPQKY